MKPQLQLLKVWYPERDNSFHWLNQNYQGLSLRSFQKQFHIWREYFPTARTQLLALFELLLHKCPVEASLSYVSSSAWQTAIATQVLCIPLPLPSGRKRSPLHNSFCLSWSRKSDLGLFKGVACCDLGSPRSCVCASFLHSSSVARILTNASFHCLCWQLGIAEITAWDQALFRAKEDLCPLGTYVWGSFL